MWGGGVRTPPLGVVATTPSPSMRSRSVSAVAFCVSPPRERCPPSDAAAPAGVVAEVAVVPQEQAGEAEDRRVQGHRQARGLLQERLERGDGYGWGGGVVSGGGRGGGKEGGSRLVGEEGIHTTTMARTIFSPTRHQSTFSQESFGGLRGPAASVGIGGWTPDPQPGRPLATPPPSYRTLHGSRCSGGGGIRVEKSLGAGS